MQFRTARNELSDFAGQDPTPCAGIRASDFKDFSFGAARAARAFLAVQWAGAAMLLAALAVFGAALRLLTGFFPSIYSQPPVWITCGAHR